MRKLLNAFLSPDDQKKIVAAVRAAEASTSAEIVPMVVGASDSYPKAELACAVAVGLVVGVLGNLAFGGQGMWLFLLFFSVFSLAAFEAAKRTPGLKRLFVSRERALHETKQAAQAAFFTHGLTKTRERNAVLVYVSVFEHLVFIQPDTGLAGTLDQRSLDALAAVLTEGIGQGKQAAALVSTIEKLAAILAPHFPPREGDTNELKDLILI
jgi:putative membrane protein